jgi:hypothetical protein
MTSVKHFQAFLIRVLVERIKVCSDSSLEQGDVLTDYGLREKSVTKLYSAMGTYNSASQIFQANGGYVDAVYAAECQYQVPVVKKDLT